MRRYNMFDKLSDNLNLLMAEAHISADELGRRTSIPASTIKKIRSRYNPNPTLSTLLPLAHYFLVTLGQLVGDEPLPPERVRGVREDNLVIPIVSWGEVVRLSSKHDCSQNIYTLIVEEDDWENLAKGTTLLVDPTLHAEHRDFAIIYKEGQAVPTLKQVLYDEERMYLKSLVQGYNITLFTPEHRILGVVVEYKKQLRKESPIKLAEVARLLEEIKVI
jgi:transcriptional regulator with XRE-family HTH domain